jgi:hypothetical protein
MGSWRIFALAPAIAVAAACSRNDHQAAADSALNADLSLASQVAPAPAIDSIEAGLNATSPHRVAATAPRSTVRRSAATRRTTSTSTSATASGGSVTTSSGGEVIVQKNTKRDAIIGAAAGAAIGAATSKDRVKGAVVGGVVGGVLGGVIGNNVDVKRTKRP